MSWLSALLRFLETCFLCRLIFHAFGCYHGIYLYWFIVNDRPKSALKYVHENGGVCTDEEYPYLADDDGDCASMCNKVEGTDIPKPSYVRPRKNAAALQAAVSLNPVSGKRLISYFVVIGWFMFVQSICHRTHITYYFSPPFLFYFSRYGFRNGAYFTTLVKIEFEFNRGGIFLISESCYFYLFPR